MTPETRALLERAKQIDTRDLDVFKGIVELLLPFPEEQRARILAASMIITGITPMNTVRAVLNA